MTKTQIYLQPMQHEALREEAHVRHLSLAALLREIVQEYITSRAHSPGPPPMDVYMSIVGMGKGGASDISERHDEYFGRAVDEHLRKHAR